MQLLTLYKTLAPTQRSSRTQNVDHGDRELCSLLRTSQAVKCAVANLILPTRFRY